MTALALREDQDYWDDSQLAVLQANGIEEGVTRAELQVYLHECQRRRLDPFTRQIYLIGRWDYKQKRKVYRSQTGIDGFRVIARRAADEAKESIEYEDTLWCGPDGQWTDVWLENEPPAACKVVVLRNGKRFPATAKHSSYVQANDQGAAVGLWRKMPDNQLAKCTEALALRKAFPEDLGGIYTEEEMAQADNPQRVTAMAEVVREEPAQQPVVTVDGAGTEDDPWYVRPEPEVSTDQEWLTATLKIIPEIGLEACRKLWPEVIGKVRAGKVAKPDGTRVMDLLKARMEALASPQETAPNEPEAASPVAAALDPMDPWAVAIEELASPADGEALLADLIEQRGRGNVTPERAALIETAIETAIASMETVAALWTVLPG